jgi:probable DNA repair protein
MPVPEEIKRAFATGTTILTANVRAARWLRREYALHQHAAGRRAWVAAPIEDWETWLGNQWRALADSDAPLLLTSLQERGLWARMQRDDAALLVSPASMAALAEGAYALLSDYEAHAERSHVWAKTDAERFRQWAAQFDRECARRNWIPRAGLESRVAALLNPETFPEEILLIGFDRTTPAQGSLLQALAACGVRVQFAEEAAADVQAEFIHVAGLREEVTACAWWARALIEKNPEARIGVLAPDLNAVRSEIERVFRRVLMPQTDDIFQAQAMPFEFSLGEPLANVPVIRAALLLLRWLRAPLSEEEASWLLLSGFLPSDGTGYLKLAKLDAIRRDSGSLSLEIGLSEFLKGSERHRLSVLAKLDAAQRVAGANGIGEAKRLPGRWVDLAQLLLKEAGWPGLEDRDTLHFQVLRRWERALDEIALLDFDGQRKSYVEFLHALESQAIETIFAPESQGAPVQIMGALESSGQRFDALWFLSADDESWPQRGRPHPLLPNDVQRRCGMPYANTESDLEFARRVTARIAASAPEVIFSHAERNKDGELRGSPLLPQNAAWRSSQPLPALIDPQPQSLEEIEDVSGRIAWPEELSPGGSEVLKLQAVCAFQAFATKRLFAESLNRREWGLSAAERGILLHETLEKIWSPSEGALHSLDDLQSAVREGRLTGILTSAISESFARFNAVDDAWMQAYLASEQRRLRARLEEWMRLEAARAPFDVVACEEELKDVDVGGLELQMRADRVDRIANSDRLLIDYKSGTVSPRDWQPPRPNEPQLPLYAVFGNVENVSGVLFAQIRAGSNCFRGHVADATIQVFADARANSVLAKEPYNRLKKDEWQEALLRLAEDFMRGEAAVNPKEGKKTCRYCPLPGLCRVAEVFDQLDEDARTEGNGSDE